MNFRMPPIPQHLPDTSPKAYFPGLLGAANVTDVDGQESSSTDVTRHTKRQDAKSEGTEQASRQILVEPLKRPQ